MSVIFSFSFMLLSSCSGSDSNLLEKLKKSVNTHIELASKNELGYSVFRLSSITDFKWDRFYVFNEYVTSGQITEITDIQWNGPTVPSGKRRILFINGANIVDYVDYEPIAFPLFIYVCGPSEQYEFYDKDDPFVVFKSCNKSICTYALAPYRCREDFKHLYSR